MYVSSANSVTCTRPRGGAPGKVGLERSSHRRRDSRPPIYFDGGNGVGGAPLLCRESRVRQCRQSVFLALAQGDLDDLYEVEPELTSGEVTRHRLACLGERRTRMILRPDLNASRRGKSTISLVRAITLPVLGAGVSRMGLRRGRTRTTRVAALLLIENTSATKRR